MKQIRDGNIVVKPTQLRAALDDYINRTPVEILKSAGGGWDYNIRGNAPVTYSLVETVRSTLSECLVDVIAPAQYAKDLATWKAENEVYQARIDALDKEAVSVEDAIVLGDQQAALIALQAFAAFEV